MSFNGSNLPQRTQTPKGLRLHIGLFGKRNAGKSSLINALTNQEISIVSDIAGTTTDPVEKACELAPIGPVVFIDTAGIDDVGALGAMRVRRTESVLGWVDIALIVCASATLSASEIALIERARATHTPAVIVLNKSDLYQPTAELFESASSYGYPVVFVSTKLRTGIDALRNAIIRLQQTQSEPDRPMMGTLVKPDDTVILVTPIDTGAPKGRLILPQVQAIREIIDAGAKCFVVREDQLKSSLESLKEPPAFVITDSQVVQRVCHDTPVSVPVTTFSIQMAQCKSDLIEMARGAAMLAFLKPGDRIMICETCSHHPQADDIGRIKIPRWLSEKIGGDLQVDVVVGKDFPADLSGYRLILQCGGCVVTRRHMMSRLQAAQRQHVAMTNYGVAISYLQGVLVRALQLHPLALKAFEEESARLSEADKL